MREEHVFESLPSSCGAACEDPEENSANTSFKTIKNHMNLFVLDNFKGPNIADNKSQKRLFRLLCLL